MQTKDWLDHSSIYSQQHNKFYRWILYPIILFFCLGGLFLFFAKKEVVIRVPAELIPEETEKLQVPVEAKIKKNNLKENLTVEQDEILVEFDTTSLNNEKKQIESANSLIEQEKEAAQIFIDSLNNEENLFESDDNYGYSNQVKSFLSEKEATFYSAKQGEESNQKEQEVYNRTKEQIEKQILIRENEKKEWQQARTAWINQQPFEGKTSEIMSNYNAWKLELADSSIEQNEELKATILTKIDDQIVQKESELEQLQLEQAQLMAPVTSDNEINSQKEKLKQNKEMALATTKQKVVELTETFNANEATLKSINEQIDQSILKAPIAGTIHLNESIKDQTDIQKGIILAELYPKPKDSQLTFTALVPANESTRIKKGMLVHFKLDKKGVSTETIDGTLTDISENSTTTDQGTFYSIRGTLQSSDKINTRYGLIGELSLIVGKKTYWQQIKEIILN